MKKVLLSIFFVILTAVVLMAGNERDVITQFLKEYIDGKETGNMKYIEIEIFKIEEGK